MRPPPADGHDRYELRDAHFYFNPKPELRLHAHDILMLIGHQASLFQFKERCGQRPILLETWQNPHA